MAAPGYLATVSATGDATAFASEPCTDSGDHITYYVTDATKRLLDLATAVVVERDNDGGAPNFADVPDVEIESINPLGGVVKFLVAQPAAAVIRLKSGKYLPKRVLASSKSFKVSLARTILENTAFNPTGAAKSKLAGLKDASGDLGLLEHLLDDYDSVKALAQTLFALMDGGVATPIEIGLGATWKLRAFALISGASPAGDVDGLIESGITWQSVAQAITGRSIGFGCTLSQW